MRNKFFDVVNDIIYSIVTILLTLSMSLQQYSTRLPSAASIIQRQHALKAQRSFLLAKRALLDQQIVEIDNMLNDPSSSPPNQTTTESANSAVTSPTQCRQRSSARRSKATTSYHRLPFSPPRTPEEVRRNNIIIWINEMRAQQSSTS